MISSYNTNHEAIVRQDHGWGGVEDPCSVPQGRARVLHSVRVCPGRRERKTHLRPSHLQAGSFFFFSNNMNNGLLSTSVNSSCLKFNVICELLGKGCPENIRLFS